MTGNFSFPKKSGNDLHCVTDERRSIRIQKAQEESVVVDVVVDTDHDPVFSGRWRAPETGTEAPFPHHAKRMKSHAGKSNQRPASAPLGKSQGAIILPYYISCSDCRRSTEFTEFRNFYIVQRIPPFSIRIRRMSEALTSPGLHFLRMAKAAPVPAASPMARQVPITRIEPKTIRSTEIQRPVINKLS